MRALLVEDDDNKAREIAVFLETRSEITEIEIARSLHAGRRALQSSIFDVVVLDMTLPNYDATADEPGGGSVHNFGGRKLLHYMDRLELRTPTIVVTQFELFLGAEEPMDLEELDRQLMRTYPTLYRGAVYYHASLSKWRLDIGALLDSIDFGRKGGEK